MITLAEAVQTIRIAETKWNQIVTDVLNKKVQDNNLVREIGHFRIAWSQNGRKKS